MPYRPRELVVRAREAASVLLATLDRNEMVARFLDMYAAEHRRPGRADQPTFYREQLQMIRRESILAAVMRIEAALPARLKVSVTVRGGTRSTKSKRKRRKGGAREEETQFLRSRSGDSVSGSFPRGVFRGAGPGAQLERTTTRKSSGAIWSCTKCLRRANLRGRRAARRRPDRSWIAWPCCSILR